MDSLPGITTTSPTLQSPPGLNKNNLFQGDMVNSATTESFVDEYIWKDLPLKWAKDFVPLALPGSRLAGVSIIAIATWPEGGNPTKGEGIQFLAVATKSAILLYETPKGSRAFRFVKVRSFVKVESYPSELFLPMYRVTPRSRNSTSPWFPGRSHSSQDLLMVGGIQRWVASLVSSSSSTNKLDGFDSQILRSEL